MTRFMGLVAWKSYVWAPQEGVIKWERTFLGWLNMFWSVGCSFKSFFKFMLRYFITRWSWIGYALQNKFHSSKIQSANVVNLNTFRENIVLCVLMKKLSSFYHLIHQLLFPKCQHRRWLIGSLLLGVLKIHVKAYCAQFSPDSAKGLRRPSIKGLLHPAPAFFS